MKRDDLRVWEKFTARDGKPSVKSRPVTDAELAEMGYVKADPLDAGLWMLTEDGQKARPAVATDMERLGYVKRPVCGECEGHKYLGEFEHVDPHTGDHLGNELIPCPSCGGSGFARQVLAALDQENK